MGYYMYVAHASGSHSAKPNSATHCLKKKRVALGVSPSIADILGCTMISPPEALF